jgi:predicted DNA-binding transcriptional regulator AlpA
MAPKVSKILDDPASPATRWVRATKVAELLDVSIRTIYRKVARGEFPRPIRIGKGSTQWRLRDVEDYLNKKRSRSKLAFAKPSSRRPRLRVYRALGNSRSGPTNPRSSRGPTATRTSAVARCGIGSCDWSITRPDPPGAGARNFLAPVAPPSNLLSCICI